MILLAVQYFEVLRVNYLAYFALLASAVVFREIYRLIYKDILILKTIKPLSHANVNNKCLHNYTRSKDFYL